MFSARIRSIQRHAEEASLVEDKAFSTRKEPLNADVASSVSGMSDVQDEVELSPG